MVDMYAMLLQAMGVLRTNRTSTVYLCAQPIEEFGREIADDDARAGSQDAFGALEGHLLQIIDACLGSSVEHGVFARHLVCGDGHVLGDFFRVGDDVQVRACGFHHDDVGALLDVSGNGSSSESSTSRWQLVAFPVAEARA